MAFCVAVYHSYNDLPIAHQVGRGQPSGLPQQASVQPQATRAYRRTSAIQLIDPTTGAEVKTEDLAKISSSVTSQSASSVDPTAVSGTISTKEDC